MKRNTAKLATMSALFAVPLILPPATVQADETQQEQATAREWREPLYTSNISVHRIMPDGSLDNISTGMVRLDRTITKDEKGNILDITYGISEMPLNYVVGYYGGSPTETTYHTFRLKIQRAWWGADWQPQPLDQLTLESSAGSAPADGSRKINGTACFKNLDQIPAEVNVFKIAVTAVGDNVKTYAPQTISFEFIDRVIVKPTDPEKPVDPEQPTDPTEPEKPVDPEQPTDPTEPEKPVDPEQPTDPTEPEKPVDPEQPTDPTEPEKPVEPEQPTDPTEPEKPVDPEQPTDPTEPEKPVDPDQPTDPAEPEKPVDPEKPTDPTEPEKPVEPEQPTDPTEPEKPVEPDQPMDPTEPEKPVDPEQPTDPAEPEKPVDPEKPTDPTEPEKPVDPDQPMDPTEPEKPVDPEQPTDPIEPEKPVDPEKPVNPVQPTDPTSPEKPVDPMHPQPAPTTKNPDNSEIISLSNGQTVRIPDTRGVRTLPKTNDKGNSFSLSILGLSLTSLVAFISKKRV